MGLKKILNRGHCRECGRKLAIPSWTICDDCDFKSFRNQYLRQQIRIEQARLKSLKQTQETRKVTDRNIARASMVLTDDITGEIIGYKL